jgi:muramidase (phage lysozyme)
MAAFTAPQALQGLRDITDAIAAQGKTGGEAKAQIDGVGLALQQMIFKNKVSAEEMTQLAERQINGYKYLGDEIARTDTKFAKLTDEERIAKVQQMAQRGMLNARTAVAVILRGMQQEFGGTAARIAQETIGGIESNLQDTLSRQLGTATGPAFQRYKKLLDELRKAAGSETADAIVGTISTSTDKLFGVMENTLRAFVSGDATSLGLNVTGAMAEAIRQGSRDVTGAASGMAQQAIDAAKETLGIKSPSTVFLEMGMNAAGAFALGLQEGLQGGVIDRATLEQAIKNPIVQTFMEALRQIEGGEPNIVVGGQRFNSRSLKPGQHPGDLGMGMMGPDGWSTAAGNWQITRTNWRRLAPQLGLTDFGDVNQQMMAALALLNESGGLAPLLRGDFDTAARHTQPWAASPFSTLPGGKRQDFLPLIYNLMNGGAAYGQPQITQSNPLPVTIVQGGRPLTIGAEGTLSANATTSASRVVGSFGGVSQTGDTLRFPSGIWGVGEPIQERFRIGADVYANLGPHTRRRASPIPNLTPQQIDSMLAASDERFNDALDNLYEANHVIVDTERSVNQFSSTIVPRAMRAIQLPAAETADAFANLPPLIKRAGDTAEEFEQQMDLAGRSVSSLFGNAAATLITDPQNLMQELRQDFRQLLSDLFRDYVESEFFKLLRPDSNSVGKHGSSILGAIFNHLFKRGSSSSTSGGATTAGTAANTVSQLIPFVSNPAFANASNGGARVGGAFGFGMPSWNTLFSNMQDLQGGSSLPAPVSVTEQNRQSSWLRQLIRMNPEFGGMEGNASNPSNFSRFFSALTPAIPLFAAYGAQSLIESFSGRQSNLQAAMGGGIFGFLINRFARRNREERERTDLAHSVYDQVIAILNEARSGRLTVSEAVARFNQVKSEYMSAVGQFQDRKTREIAQRWFIQDVESYYHPLIQQAAKQGEEARARAARMNPVFADGGSVLAGVLNMRRFADGGAPFIYNPQGYIQGPGSSRSDSITAYFPTARSYGRISDTEYVLDAQTTAAIGVERLDRIRANRGRGLAEGGAVAVDSSLQSSSTDSRFTVIVHNTPSFDGKQILIDTIVEILDSETGRKSIHKAMAHPRGRKITIGTAERWYKWRQT